MPKHTLEEVRAEYRRLDCLCGVSTEQIQLRVSTRATKRYGECHYYWQKVLSSPEGGYYVPDRITITDFIMDCDGQFWDVIRHEYAHALCMLRDGKKHGHDAVWKAACKEIGCNPERLNRSTETYLKAVKKREECYKWIVQCHQCGRTWRYMRAGRSVNALRKKKVCTCPKCGGHSFKVTDLRKKGAKK